MPKTALLSQEEVATAASQGWALAEVYDPVKNRLALQIHPLQFTASLRSPEAATRAVVELARAGHPTALKALRAAAKGHPRETRNRRPK